MKKLISILSLVFIFILTSCQTNTEVPFLVYDNKDLYIQEVKKSLYENKREDLNINSYDSKNSQIIQNEIINDVLDEKPPLIIVNPVDRLGAYTIIEKSKESDIPIIFVNREPLRKDLYLWDQVYYIGAKAEYSAIYQAELVMELFGNDPDNLNEFDINNDGKIQCIILKGQLMHQDSEIRTEVVVSEMERNGFELDVLAIEGAEFKSDVAYELMKIMIPKYLNEVEVIISNNDAMAIGAINALKEANIFEDVNGNGIIDKDVDSWLPVVGIDGIDEALELIDRGYLYGTVINDTDNIAKAIIDVSKAIIDGEDINDINDINYDIEDGKYIWIDYKKYSLPIKNSLPITD